MNVWPTDGGRGVQGAIPYSSPRVGTSAARSAPEGISSGWPSDNRADARSRNSRSRDFTVMDLATPLCPIRTTQFRGTLRQELDRDAVSPHARPWEARMPTGAALGHAASS